MITRDKEYFTTKQILNSTMNLYSSIIHFFLIMIHFIMITISSITTNEAIIKLFLIVVILSNPIRQF